MTQSHKPKRSLLDWKKEVSQWRASGLSMKDYCREAGLITHQLGYYKRKFSSHAIRPDPPSSSFAQVSLASSQETFALRLRLPSGHIIEGISASNLPLVQALIGALQ